MRRRGRGWFAAFFLLVPAGVVAQTSRTAVIEQQVRDKEQALRPYEPGRLEKLALLAESPFDPSKPSTAVRSGWYPLFGTLPLRGGLSFGAGYRTRLPGRATADASLALSFRGYRQLQAGVTVPDLGGRPIDVRVSARFRDYPRERFFGIGGDALVGDRVSYTMRDADYVVALTAHPNEWLKAGLDAGYLSSALRPGRDSRFPSVEQRFADLLPLGFADQPDFLHARAFVEASSLDIPGNPRSGGRYSVAIGRHASIGAFPASFNRVDLEAMHLFPFFDKRRVIALRGVVSMARPDGGAELPFYLMPSLGGSRSLRGFDEVRFRDRNLILIGAEYRWEVFGALDMALFVDAGKVTHRVRDLNLAHLHIAPGIGFRFNELRNVVLTFDIAQGPEGRRYLLTFGPQW